MLSSSLAQSPGVRTPTPLGSHAAKVCNLEEPAHEPAPAPAVHASPEEPAQSTATKPRPAPPKLDQLPQFRVLLNNDDHNSFDWVIDSIMELTPHRKESAMLLTWEAHATGVSLLLVTHKERAELYQDQFKSKKLIVTIEPAE